MEKSLPKLLENTLKESIKRLKQLQQENQDTQQSIVSEQQASKVGLNIEPKVIVDKEQGFIQAEIVAGRDTWLKSQKYLLTKHEKVFSSHKWSIVEPAPGFEWLTSDHPVVRLNYYGSNSYDLRGGWGNKGTNLFMPISPKHLLFTQIGDEFPDRFTLSVQRTEMLQNYLAERALRWIFSRKRQTNVSKYRPRYIDAEAVKEEKAAWDRWHKEQSSSEEASEN